MENLFNKSIKKQTMEGLFKTTFKEVINSVNESNVYICGRKMYILLENKIIISIEFTGTQQAFNNVVLMALCKNSIIDQNITPLFMIFKESKLPSGMEKLVNSKIVYGATGEYSFVWSADLSESDSMSLNNFVLNYIELFNSL